MTARALPIVTGPLRPYRTEILKTHRGDGAVSVETWKTDGQMESYFTTVYAPGGFWDEIRDPPGPWFKASNTEAEARVAHEAMVQRLDDALMASSETGT